MANPLHIFRGKPAVRLVYALCLMLTVGLGLATRRWPAAFPDLLAIYGGDALWAAMVYWLLALLRPRTAVPKLVIVAAAISLAIELSQLYSAPWINTLRATRLGALILGHGFLWSDLACYAAGIAAAALLDTALRRALHCDGSSLFTRRHRTCC